MNIIAITPNNKFDTTAASIIVGFNNLGHNIIASDLGNNVKKSYSDADIIKYSKKADLILVFWGKIRGNKPPKYYLLNKINRPDITAYIDGSEWSMTGYNDTGNDKLLADFLNKPRMLNRQVVEAKIDSKRYRGKPWVWEEMFQYAKWYFKRECYQEDINRGIIPLSFCAFPEYFNSENLHKDIDLFCSFGQEITGLRSEIIKKCKQLQSEGYKIKIVGCGGEGKVSMNEYSNLISRSFMGVTSWGAGNYCRRLFEIMAKKTCCLSQKLNVEFPNGPIDKKSYLEFKTILEFENKFKEYIKKPEECIRIGNQGYHLMRNHHTCEKRVLYMLDIMGYNKQ